MLVIINPCVNNMLGMILFLRLSIAIGKENWSFGCGGLTAATDCNDYSGSTSCYCASSLCNIQSWAAETNGAAGAFLTTAWTMSSLATVVGFAAIVKSNML